MGQEWKCSLKQKDRAEDVDGVLVDKVFGFDLRKGRIPCNSGIVDDDVNLEFSRSTQDFGVSFFFRTKVETIDGC